jgi:hypothetical protein
MRVKIQAGETRVMKDKDLQHLEGRGDDWVDTWSNYEETLTNFGYTTCVIGCVKKY